MLPAAPLASLALALLSAIDVTARPEDTGCPSRAALAVALEGRVPEASVRWSVRYRVEARADAAADNHVWLELRDEQGDLRLRRELAIADDECPAAADGIALIVSRFFREVSWTGAVPLPDMERAPEPPPPASPPGRPWELQAGLALRRAVTLSPGLALEMRLPVGGVWVAQAGVVVQPRPVSELVGAGSVRLWNVPVRGSFRRLVARGPLGVDLGPQATLAVEWAVPQDLPGASAASRLVAAVGAAGSARWAFAHGWMFALDFAAEATIFAPSFLISSPPGPGTVLVPQRVQLHGLVGVARAF